MMERLRGFRVSLCALLPYECRRPAGHVRDLLNLRSSRFSQPGTYKVEFQS